MTFARDRASFKGKVMALDQLESLTKQLQVAGFAVDQVRYALDFELAVDGPMRTAPVSQPGGGR